MKRRVFSILTALCLCLTLLPVAAFATEGSGAAPAEEPQQEQQEEVNPEANPEQPEGQPEVNPAEQPAAENVVPVALNGEGETVIKLMQSNISDYVPNGLTGGSYQLGENVTITSGTLKVSGTVTLDLNGYKLTIKNPPNTNVQYYNKEGDSTSEPNPIGILVYSDVDGSESYTLTLKDSSEAKTGTLNVEGEGAKDATGIYVGRNCTLNIEGGTITNSYQRSGNDILSSSGVQAVLGTVKMTGGSIKKQTYGVMLWGSNMTISDNAEISDCGYLDVNVSRSGSGVFVMRGYLASTDKSGINGTNIVASALTMTGGTIENCMSASSGGGVYLEAESTFTMTGGTITGCKSGENGVGPSDSKGGGGVYAGGTFTMSGSASITNCEAADFGCGGGVYVGGKFTMSDDAKITGCTSAAGGGVYVSGDPSGQTAFTMSDNARITNCEAIGGCGGGVYLARCTFTMKDTASITGCTAAEAGGNVKDGDCIMIESSKSVTLNIADTVTINGQITQYVSDSNRRIDGLGTAEKPYQIGTAEGLKWFRDKVNGGEYGLCAVLTADIDLGGEAWTPIGKYNNTPYTGTFDGKGYTISGLNVTGNNFMVAGLFGAVEVGTIKNLTVAGKVSPSSPQCIAGGIVGYALNATIENCSNHCSVTGIAGSHIGGIAGVNVDDAKIIDCYNVGTIRGINYAEVSGGIVGSNSGTISNCYNVGTVSNDTSVGEIAGHNFDTVENCYYLTGGSGSGTPMTAAQFADGTVLKLLINDRDDSEHPWNSQCQYLAAAGKTLPVFKTQTGDAHTHDWSAWTHMEGTETHRRSCTTCNAVETVRCSGGAATCTAKAVCAVCGAEYGDIDPNHHGGKLKHVEAKAATTSEEGNIEYWHCEACGKYFSDAKAEHEITQADTVIPKRRPSGNSTSYPITIPDKTDNGSVTVSPKSASKGSTVTVAVTPDKGYALETLTVTDKSGSVLDLTDKGGGQYTFTMPPGPVTVTATFMDDNTMLNFFVDVPAGAYYYDAVLWAAEGGIVTGTDAVHFSPNASCTRAQLVTFLWRAAGKPVVNYAMNFTDVDGGAYYAEAVRWAASEKIVEGTTAETFAPNAAVTRAQVVTMLYRFAKAQGMDTTQGGMAVREFDDFDAVPAYAIEAMDWAVNVGVLKGDNNRLLPQNACTRAQIVTLLWRACSK